MGSKVKTNTWVVTNTSTNIRDIGFTGQNAIDLVGVIEGGAIEREQLQLQGFKELTNNLSKITDLTGRTQETALSSVSGILGTAKSAAASITESAVAAAKENRSELMKALPLVLAAVVGIAALPLLRK